MLIERQGAVRTAFDKALVREVYNAEDCRCHGENDEILRGSSWGVRKKDPPHGPFRTGQDEEMDAYIA